MVMADAVDDRLVMQAKFGEAFLTTGSMGLMGSTLALLVMVPLFTRLLRASHRNAVAHG